MDTSRTPISSLIFDAGDILVHKIPDYQLLIWNEISAHFQVLKMDIKERFRQLYDQVRTLGSGFKFDNVSLGILSLKISLIEEYEIEKWWNNPDPLVYEIIPQFFQIGYKIGVLTDSALSSKRIREVLPRLSPYVDKIVSSRDIGVMKPDKQMYFTILEQLGTIPEKALFIAHDPDEIKGALSSKLLCEDFESIGDLGKLVEIIQRKYVLAL
ncbi:MAG: HAD hydrolase-like protein [Candidatus Heimdallarchaeota archaeon]|nr:MAG: HAD hydrolase-like protein [Candidatus Heimdallarchaeota archaeon]